MSTAEARTQAQAAHPSPDPAAKDLLRFITCGSVDDGKSTLIGRLLWDSRHVFEDERARLVRESQSLGRVPPGEIDYALLVDGLSAEREQGITIDVAYRFFETDRRKFIVADTPGHEQYTRNMATGASTAELAVLLVDAVNGLLTQTRRHATIAHLMGIRHVVVAVNKMDLVDWNGGLFRAIEREFGLLADGLGIEHVLCIPVSALSGDNVSTRSPAADWYDGPALMEYLETVQVERPSWTEFRFPVQWVNRPDASFRGFSGSVAGGAVAVGDRVTALPSHKEAEVARIVTKDGDLSSAAAGDAVTLVLDREIDVARGDMLVSADDRTVSVADQLQADLIWMGEEPLVSGRQYLVRMGAATTAARVSAVKHRLDIESHAHIAAKTLALNEIGSVTVTLDRPLPFDAYAANRATGSLILIDRYSNATVGAGMVQHALRRATNVVWHQLAIDKAVRARLKNQRPCCLWFTGLSGSGKSTVANMVDQRLTAEGHHTYVLDGDNVRHGLNGDLGFTEADRVENIRRLAEVAKLMVDAGLIVLVCAISPYRKDREMARGLFGEGEFVEVFVDTPLEACEARDPKGLYQKARQGQIPNFTGISAPYERPDRPEVRLDGVAPAMDLAHQVYDLLAEGGIEE